MKHFKQIPWVLLLSFSLTCHGADGNQPPANASDAQKQAFAAANAVRTSAGLPEFTMLDTLNAAAQNHANYYVNNPDAYANGLSPHDEDPNFPNGFTGVNFWDRMSAAGFTGQAFFEVMAFVNDPQKAVPGWVNSVIHRIPIIHPNSTQMGYGGASGPNNRSADVIDFGGGASADPAQIVVFPPPNATDVPPSFDTTSEGPMPPPPPGGGTVTGPIISVLFDTGNSSADISVHELRDSAGNLLPHTFISPSTPQIGPFMTNSFAFYADGPAASGTTFSVHIEGTSNGTAFAKDWSFTTSATPAQ